MKVREVFEKSRFLGKQLNRPMWRFFVAVLCVPIAGEIAPALSGPAFENAIRNIIAGTFFFSIPIVMLPVILWGNLWQKVFALLLSALPILIILVAIFGPRSARPF